MSLDGWRFRGFEKRSGSRLIWDVRLYMYTLSDEAGALYQAYQREVIE